VSSPKDPNELIVPAHDGTLRVLRAALDAGVKRVVMTSSTAASNDAPIDRDSINDETNWTEPKAKDVNAYRQSKAIAERAPWDLVASRGAAAKLATILPTAVFGPVLTPENLGSVQVISRLLQGALPGSPRLGFNVVDVRDVVDGHMRAMTSPLAGGERFIVSGDHLWVVDIARVLRSELGDKAKRVPARLLPDFLFRLAALFDPTLKELAKTLGRKHVYKSDKARRVLGWSTRPAKATIVECAQSLIAKGAVQ
jgi:nucleoside-diphosphate-sugar epimerase